MVDLGCWPGGWLQVAAAEVGSGGRVVGVDRAAIDPPLTNANVFAFTADLAEAGLAERIRESLGGPADLLLSDAAPKLTGIRITDRAREEELLEAVGGLLPDLLKPGGTALVKILESPEAQAWIRTWGRRFDKKKTVSTEAKRQGSSEKHWFAQGFRA